MELFNAFLQKIETGFPLSYKSTKGCFNISNSGRRVEAKEFSLSYESIISALNDIKNNIEHFSSVYDESKWRAAASVFSDNTIKSFCGVQTKPFFETINKLISWANNLHHTDGQMELSLKSISNLLDRLETIDCFDNESLNPNNENLSSYIKNFSQIIYYGVPGCGKSHSIDTETNDLPEEQKIRVVFHPEYTNADFIGQVLPKVISGDVKYEFKPGPFTKILYRAFHNPDKKYYLIIEEINRGNAAAIFGDVFQLLDRIEKGDEPVTLNSNTFKVGWSKYFVENDFINNYLRSPVEYSDEGFTEEHDQKTVNFADTITFTENTGIRQPPNLSLLATMNTSDQNVFTLDNAFQRRWDMELVKNVVDKEKVDKNGIKHGKIQMEATITVANQKITWEHFQQTINAVIGEKSNEGGLSSMEDKRLGCWFVKAENGAISKEIFANKVLKYLWDDAFKFCHQEVFDSDIKNFEELQKRFLEIGFDIFSENCGLKEFVSTGSTTTETTSTEQQAETSEQ